MHQRQLLLSETIDKLEVRQKTLDEIVKKNLNGYWVTIEPDGVVYAFKERRKALDWCYRDAVSLFITKVCFFLISPFLKVPAP